MGLSVVSNVPALAAHRSLARTDAAGTRSLERLSSGARIGRAADDAAGLAISEGLRAQVGGVRVALRNAQDGISLIRTADGALDAATSVVRRMRDLAVQAANAGGLDETARTAIQTEIGHLKQELTRIGTQTTFNGTPLFDGSYRGTFQVGPNQGETVIVEMGSPGTAMDLDGLGLSGVDVTGTMTLPHSVDPAVSDQAGVPAAGRLSITGDFTTPGVYPGQFAGLAGTVTYDGRSFDLGSVDYSGAVTATDHIAALNSAAMAALGTGFVPFVGSATELVLTGETPGAGSTVAEAAAITPRYTGRSGASGAIPLLDGAVGRITSLRAYLGAMENRFEHTVARLGVTLENTTDSMSRIRDADMALEMTEFSRNQIISQAGTAMLSAAVETPRNLLSLLS
jgi:flagellin-like hook-associated protein FlgL